MCRPQSSVRYHYASLKERLCGLFTVSSNTCAVKISAKVWNEVFCRNSDKRDKFSVSTADCRFSPSASQIMPELSVKAVQRSVRPSLCANGQKAQVFVSGRRIIRATRKQRKGIKVMQYAEARCLPFRMVP